MRCQVVCPKQKDHCGCGRQARADKGSQEVPAHGRPTASSEEPHEGWYSEKSPGNHQDAGHSSHRLHHRERKVGHTMSTGAVR